MRRLVIKSSFWCRRETHLALQNIASSISLKILFIFRCLVALNHSADRHTPNIYCMQFLWWRFVAYLKWRSILHIFKKSLANRTAGERALVEIELGANWVLFILCGLLVLIIYIRILLPGGILSTITRGSFPIWFRPNVSGLVLVPML